jgi:predicted DNA-binding protein
MSRALSVRLTDELFQWLKNTSRLTGLPMARIIRECLEDAKMKQGRQRLLRHSGAIKGGPDNVSSRKGFSRG